MGQFPDKLSAKIEKRIHNGALRTLRVPPGHIDFYSNDYLGFARETAIFKDTLQLLDRDFPTPNGSTGSRLLSGNHDLYEKLELLLADHHKSKAALVFNSGYDANIGFFSAVPQRGDIILYDELIHASIRDGIKMSDAKGFKFAHNNLDDLEEVLHRVRGKQGAQTVVYLVTESVFSMDGDTPDLIAMTRLAGDHNCNLVVDEAHAVGVFGKKGGGLVPHLNCGEGVFARIITFGKALGAHGAAILGDARLRQYLINYARSFIYTTALPPHSVATLLAAYQFLDSSKGSEQRQKLLDLVAYFKEQLVVLGLTNYFVESDSPIQSCIIPGNTGVAEMAVELQQHGFGVKPIRSPTVPEGMERLRFCLHAYNGKAAINRLLSLVQQQITGG